MTNGSNYSPSGPDGGFEHMRRRLGAYTDTLRPLGSTPRNASHATALPDETEKNQMTTPTREEIDAKLELIETKMDGRVASIERTVQASIDESRETRRDIKNLRWTIIVTAVATVVGLWGVNATIFSNMVTSFDSGKNTATAQAEVKRAAEETKKSAEETAAALKRIQQQLDAQDTERAKRTKVDGK